MFESLFVVLIWILAEPCGYVVAPSDTQQTDTVLRRELITSLCVDERTHSQAIDRLPDRCGTSRDSRELAERALREIADYRAPTERNKSGSI